MMSINGPSGGPPTRVGFSVGDISAALFATVGILERLYRRDAGGEQGLPPLDVSMLACQWACLENAFARYLNAGIVPRPLGSRHPSMTPFDVYPTADRDIVIALGSYLDWPRFCEVLDMPLYIDDPRFKYDEARIDHADEMDRILAERLRTRTAAEWIDALLARSIPCALVEDIESIANSDIAREYAAFAELDNGMRFVRNPIADAGAREAAAPQLGQHGEEILRELGYADEAIAAVLHADP